MSTSDVPSSARASTAVKVQRQTMAGQVANDLRRRILSGELQEGVQLRQEQLAAEFGISKVPIREALHQLEAEGFVTQQFHKGAVVAGLSPDQVTEIFELRTQIELWLLGLGMEAATKEDIRRAREIGHMIGATEDSDIYPELNWQFHEALYRPSKKLFAIDHLRKLYAQIERYVRLQFTLAQTKQTVMKEHDALLKLYARKDPAAVKMLQDHIMGSANQLALRLVQIKQGRNPEAAR